MRFSLTPARRATRRNLGIVAVATLTAGYFVIVTSYTADMTMTWAVHVHWDRSGRVHDLDFARETVVQMLSRAVLGAA